METVEEAVIIMKELLVHQGGRLDDYYESFNRERREREESRKDFEFKLNALISAEE